MRKYEAKRKHNNIIHIHNVMKSNMVKTILLTNHFSVYSITIKVNFTNIFIYKL